MADLSMVYGSMYDEPPSVQQMSKQLSQDNQDYSPPPVIAKASQSHAVPQDVPYNPPTAMYNQQNPEKPAQIVSYHESFLTKLGNKKYEIIKFILLALIIALGISFDRVATYYVNTYIGKSILTDTQELFVRLSYPIIIILMLWFLKAMY